MRRLDPKDPLPYAGIAWMLSTCPKDEVRNGKKAVEYARKACELTNWKNASYLAVLVAAFAEVGNFEEAVQWQKKVIALTDATAEKDLEEQRQHLKLYQERKPYRFK
jgi:hypothetical protein